MIPRDIVMRTSRHSAISISPEVSRILCVALVSVAIITPAMIWGIPSNRDLFNHFRFALPFYDSLCDGRLYPAWLAESNSGYGDPSFRFYPPAFYYLLALARTLTGNWYAGTLLTYTLISVLGGLGVYFWTRSLLTENAAMVAGILFALAPYHVNELYMAVMLAEYAGAAVLPFAFGFVDRVCRHGRPRDIAGLAAAYSILILTHLPLTVIGSIALLGYAVMRMDKANWFQSLKKLSVAVALALMASAVYWIRMITELHWIGANMRSEASIYYRSNFIFSTLSAANLNVWWMNILILTTLLLFAPAFFLLSRRIRIEERFGRLKPIILIAAFAFFMSSPLSRPVWSLFPLLQQVQFPWRWLALFSMAGCVVTAALISSGLGLAGLPRPGRLLVFGAISLSVIFTLGHVVREAEYKTRAQFDDILHSVRGSASIDDWLPIWAKPAPRVMPVEVEAGNRRVTISSWKPEYRSFQVSAGEAMEARVRTFYYPRWVAIGGGQVLSTRPDQDGAMLISVPAAETKVSLEFREPKSASFAVGITILGWLVIGILGISGFLRGTTNKSL
jgi:6-pyruvoyl-tetrahydropterin synthase related domain